MFKTDQPQIQAFAKKSPKNTARVIKFVLVSIRRNFAQVEDIMTGKCEPNMMSLTKEGIAYAEEHALELHSIIHDSRMPLHDKLLAVTRVPGLGLPKAGFVLQLCCGEVGCLDTHNLRNFGLDAKDFKLTKNMAKNIERAKVYVDCCRKEGGCEYLWDQWCEFIAERWASKWNDAKDVSHAHVRGIVR